MTARSAPPLRVVLIGPECTGKTWLARDLAERYAVPWSPEFAREFVDRHPRPVTYADVDAIGRGQKMREDEARALAETRGTRLVIHDTDLVSTAVYSRHYYGDCPEWIERESPDRLGDLYLLHRPDVAWSPDGFQREAPARREELFERFRAALDAREAAVVEIFGSWDERRVRAQAAIDALLAAHDVPQ